MSSFMPHCFFQRFPHQISYHPTAIIIVGIIISADWMARFTCTTYFIDDYQHHCGGVLRFLQLNKVINDICFSKSYSKINAWSNALSAIHK
ncbi:unnamed protein product [Ceratitis capitata]|uniref:(Mediterranean fruit fly) hypothetical protein n=1 Tax=Ceratitis capitata TaxID=7213 RepID=A0A811UZX8_CERCA|nr:unnamed protein product [Ceratitis capitata]